jgi:hypothetical protein
MATLGRMPQVQVTDADLAPFGAQWAVNGRRLSRTAPHSSGQLGFVFDRALGNALAAMLGGIPVVKAAAGLLPPMPDCVEVGPLQVVGGVRVQNYDVGYRPDGVRFLCDSKTLNDKKSVGKNSLNMINDLATEASTAHLRFPYAVVAFIVAFPEPCIEHARQVVMIETLERMTGRVGVSEPVHEAEAISFVLWDPATGAVNPGIPAPESPLRLERLSDQIEAAYRERYKGDPPHR